MTETKRIVSKIPKMIFGTKDVIYDSESNLLNILNYKNYER
jgi:hypothetical protein